MKLLIKFNAYNFLIGFLVINSLSAITVGKFHIDTFSYKVISLILSIIIFLYLNIKEKKGLHRIYKNKIFKLYLIFSCLYLFRVFIDTFLFNVKLPDSDGIYDFLMPIAYIIIIPISLISITSLDVSKIILNTFWFVASLFIINVLFSPTTFGVVEQRMSVFENMGKQGMGIFAAILFTWSIVKFFKEKKWRLSKIILFPLMIISLFYMAVSGTRSIFVCAFVVLFLFLVRNFKDVFIRQIITIIIFIGFIIVTFPYWFGWLELVINRFNSVFLIGLGAREYIRNEAINMFITSPLFGNYHIIPDTAYFHNFFLDAFVSTGIIGGTIFTVLNLKVLKICYKWLKSSYDLHYQFIAILYILSFVFGMFSSALFKAELYWGALLIVVIVDSNDVGILKKQSNVVLEI